MNDMVRRMNNLVELQQIREHLVEKSKFHRRKSKKPLTRKQKWKISKLVTGFSNGMWWRKRKVIMVSLTPYGQVHLSSPKFSRTIPLFYTVWKEKMSLAAWSMGDSWNLISFKALKPWYCKYVFQFLFFLYNIGSMPNGTLGDRFDFGFIIKALLCSSWNLTGRLSSPEVANVSLVGKWPKNESKTLQKSSKFS